MIPRPIRLYLGIERDFDVVLPYAIDESAELFFNMPQSEFGVFFGQNITTPPRILYTLENGDYHFQVYPQTRQQMVLTGTLQDNGYNSTLLKGTIKGDIFEQGILLFFVFLFVVSGFTTFVSGFSILALALKIVDVQHACNNIPDTMDTILMLEHKKSVSAEQ